MKPYERMFVHELASAYALRSQSYDPEPNRNVVIFAPGAAGAWGLAAPVSGPLIKTFHQVHLTFLVLLLGNILLKTILHKVIY